MADENEVVGDGVVEIPFAKKDIWRWVVIFRVFFFQLRICFGHQPWDTPNQPHSRPFKFAIGFYTVIGA